MSDASKSTSKPTPSSKASEAAKKAVVVSVWVLVLINVVYSFTSSGLTFINKALYNNFHFSSPLNLLLI